MLKFTIKTKNAKATDECYAIGLRGFEIHLQQYKDFTRFTSPYTYIWLKFLDR